MCKSEAVKAGETSELNSHYDKRWHRFTQRTFPVQIYSTNRDVCGPIPGLPPLTEVSGSCVGTPHETLLMIRVKKKTTLNSRLQTVNEASRISLFEMRDKISFFFVWLDVFVGGSVIKVTPSAWRAVFQSLRVGKHPAEESWRLRICSRPWPLTPPLPQGSLRDSLNTTKGRKDPGFTPPKVTGVYSGTRSSIEVSRESWELCSFGVNTLTNQRTRGHRWKHKILEKGICSVFKLLTMNYH